MLRYRRIQGQTTTSVAGSGAAAAGPLKLHSHYFRRRTRQPHHCRVVGDLALVIAALALREAAVIERLRNLVDGSIRQLDHRREVGDLARVVAALAVGDPAVIEGSRNQVTGAFGNSITAVKSASALS